jgi:membrane-associated phospholipid phosphatase
VWFPKPYALAVLVPGFLLMGFSRFILGVHSANQILYGYLWGGWTYLVVCYWLRDHIYTSLKSDKPNGDLLKVTIYSFLGILATFGV